MSHLLDADDTNLSQILVNQLSKVVALFFWAPWDEASSQTQRDLEDIAAKYQDKLIVIKINIDQNPHSPVNYNVRSIPHVSLLSKGRPTCHLEGAHEAQKFCELIEKQLKQETAS
jgi:thioredoxin 1